MKTLTANRPVSRKELVSILKNTLSREYKYELVESNQERYLLVKKNPFIGAKVFHEGNKITIEAVVPTFGGYLFAFAATFYTGMFLGVPLPWLSFEKSVGYALLSKLQ
jgi:hypothetical protein